MIRRIKLPGWIFIILLFFGIIVGISQMVAKFLVESPESHRPNEKIEDFHVYPGLNIKTETEETAIYTLSVSKPYTDNEQINKSISEWIDNQKKEFTADIKKRKDSLEEKKFRAHLNIQVETKEIAVRLYTLEFQVYKITGGANGLTTIKSFVIDLNENKQLQFNDVFKLDEGAIERIQKLIMESLYNNQKISPYLFDDMVQKVLKSVDKLQWSVSKDNVTFYFDEYEIAAGAAGEIKVKIPIKEIKPYLNEKIVEQIDVNMPEKEKYKKEEQHTEDYVKLNPGGKYVALTFDDGPHPKVTPSILDTLKKHDAKATFFMLGSQVKYYPELANKVGEAGHEIGNHTMNHSDLTTLGLNQIEEEIKQASNIIETATGRTPKLLRPPYGAANGECVQVAVELGDSLVIG